MWDVFALHNESRQRSWNVKAEIICPKSPQRNSHSIIFWLDEVIKSAS